MGNWQRWLRRACCAGRVGALLCGVVLSSACAGGGDTKKPATGDGDGDGDNSSPTVCEVDDDCSDNTFCNGQERCNPDHADADGFGCLPPADVPCSDNGSCDENDDACGCEDPDADGDGQRSVMCGGQDCDDDDANRFPGNEEICDSSHHDEDCDPSTFGVRDQDSDEDPDDECCNEDSSGDLICGTDCNDDDGNQHSFNTEVCDDVDNDCDGLVDETIDGNEDDGLKVVFTIDFDGDGFGSDADDAETALACTAPEGYVASSSDCNDDEGEVNPGAVDSCNDEIDNNCSGTPNDPPGGCACEGNESQVCGLAVAQGGLGLVGACAAYSRQCNDGTWDDCPLLPNSDPEVCDALGVDEDCDGIVNGEAVADDLKVTYYRDRDGDGYPDLQTSAEYCTDLEPAGWISGENPDDCVDELLASDPGSDDIYPGATEVCNTRDDDCDNFVDALDDSLSGSPMVSGTTFACTGGVWQVTGCPPDLLHCDQNLGNGCETDATSLDSCGSCSDACLFSCGATGCDEPESIAAGFQHTCAVTVGGRVACWGKNTTRQAQNSAVDPVLEPAFISGISSATAVSSGYAHTCVIDAGVVKCWGSDIEDQLGPQAAGQTFSGTPLQVTGLTGVASVAAGYMHSCAVDGSTNVRCWGERDGGKLGNGVTSNGRTPNPTTVTLPDAVTALTGATQVVTGFSHSCALTSMGKVFCWGDHSLGQLGVGTASSAGYAMDTGLTGVAQIAAAGFHTCAVLTAGGVRCWGSNDLLQVGVTPSGIYDTPQTVPGISNAASVAAGSSHTCIRRTTSAVACWGSNLYGERGDATPAAESATPVTVSSLSASFITAGSGGHTCAVSTSNAQGVCWGANASSQLGNGLLSSTHTRQNILAIP